MTKRELLERNLSQSLSCLFMNPYFRPRIIRKTARSLGPCPPPDEHHAHEQHAETTYIPSNLEFSKPDIKCHVCYKSIPVNAQFGKVHRDRR